MLKAHLGAGGVKFVGHGVKWRRHRTGPGQGEGADKNAHAPECLATAVTFGAVVLANVSSCRRWPPKLKPPQRIVEERSLASAFTRWRVEIMQSLMARLSGPDLLAVPAYVVAISGPRPSLLGRGGRWCWRDDRAEASENGTVLYPTPVVFLDRVQF